MANVKISELPTLTGYGASNDVVIVNDTSSATTCKSTLSALLGSNATIATSVNFISLEASATPTATFTRIVPRFAKLTITSSANTVTNNTASAVKLSFSVPHYFNPGNVVLMGNSIKGSYQIDTSGISISDAVSFQWRVTTSGTTATFSLECVVRESSGNIVAHPVYIPAGGTCGISINVSCFGISNIDFAE